MRVRRIGWAGIEIEENDTRVAIDPIGTLGFFEEFWGEESDRDELVQLEAGSLDGVLLTHLHRDHADPEAIVAALKVDGVVAGPPEPRFVGPNQKYSVMPQEDGLSERGIDREQFVAGESLQIGDLTAVACESVDGTGVNQVAWLVRGADGSLLHCGDTIWHGAFWEIAAEHGKIDVACLPANGVEVAFPYNQPYVDQPADLTPEQAVDAAYVLQAGTLMPIHFSLTYDHDQLYRPVRDAETRLRAAAENRGVTVHFPGIGEWSDVSATAAAHSG